MHGMNATPYRSLGPQEQADAIHKNAVNAVNYASTAVSLGEPSPSTELSSLNLRLQEALGRFEEVRCRLEGVNARAFGPTPEAAQREPNELHEGFVSALHATSDRLIAMVSAFEELSCRLERIV